MIEVRGMLGAVEAADAALKSAAVSLLRSRKVGGGLVTVFLAGDVAAVRSAVDAAVASLNRLGLRCSSHVIPRLAPDVLTMIVEGAEENVSGEHPSTCTTCTIADVVREEDAAAVSPVEEAVEEDKDKDKDKDKDDTGSGWSGNMPDLENMTVMELRRLARTVGLKTMTKKQIRFAGKAELLRELRAFWNNRGGEME